MQWKVDLSMTRLILKLADSVTLYILFEQLQVSLFLVDSIGLQI